MHFYKSLFINNSLIQVNIIFYLILFSELSSISFRIIIYDKLYFYILLKYIKL